MWSLMCFNQEDNHQACKNYINNYVRLSSCTSFVFFLVLPILLLLGLSSFVQAQSSVESVRTTEKSKQQSQAVCYAEESLIEIDNKDYGTVLWVDGVRYGFIPLKPFCLPFGLHLFELYRTSPSELNWKPNRMFRFPIWSQVIWVPNQEDLKVEINQLETSFKPNIRINNKSKNLESLKGSSSKQSKQDLDHLKLTNETVITAKPQSVYHPQLNQQKLINRQSIRYHHLPHDQLDLYVDIQGLRDLFEPSQKTHMQDPTTQRFELWVQELYVSFGWPSLVGGYSKQKNRQRTHSKAEQKTKKLETGQAKVGRFIRQSGARIRRLDGLELFQPLSTFVRGKGMQRSHYFGLSFTLAQNLAQNLTKPIDTFLTAPTYRNLWGELGLNYRQIFHDLDNEFKSLKLKLSAIYLDQKALSLERVSDLGHASSPLDTTNIATNILGLFDLEWSHGEWLLKSHFAYNLLGQLSHSYQEIIVPKTSINIGLKARWQYFLGDQWDQQWLDSSFWPNTYQNPMLSLNQALYWQDVSLAYGYQKGQPSWHKSHHQINAVHQVLSLAWGPLGSALIKLPKQNFLKQRFTQLAQQRESEKRSEKSSVKPEQKKIPQDFIYQVEALLVKEPNQDQLTQANQGTSKLPLNTRSLKTRLLISGSGALTKRSQKHEFSLEARLSYAIDTHEWWPELSLGWQFEQVKLSTECAKPLASPQTIEMNRWLAYCGLLIDIDAWLKQ